MNSRQKSALAHPVLHGDVGKRPHSSRVEIAGNRITILDVAEALPAAWVWRASVSFGVNAGIVKSVRIYTKKQSMKAQEILKRLLDGVGKEVVLRVVPVDQPIMRWDEAPLPATPIPGNPDVLVLMKNPFAAMLPVPREFTAMHAWKSLTDEELEQVLAKTGGKHGESTTSGFSRR